MAGLYGIVTIWGDRDKRVCGGSTPPKWAIRGSRLTDVPERRSDLENDSPEHFHRRALGEMPRVPGRLPTLRDKLIKIGPEVMRHAGYLQLRLLDVPIPTVCCRESPTRPRLVCSGRIRMA